MAIDFADLAVRVNYSEVDKAAAALERLKTASAGAEASTNKVGVSSIAATRNMGAWAAIQAEAAGNVGEHSLNISRLERNLSSSAEKILGLNSTLALLGSSFLKFGVGDVYTVAILGGLYAVTKAYDLLTESTRKAKEEHDKLVTSLQQGNADAALGPDPELVKQTNAERDQLRQEQSRRRLLLNFGVDPNDNRILELNRQIKKDQEELTAGEERLTKARLAAQGFLEPIKVESTYARDAREAAINRDREQAEHFIQVSDAAKHHQEDLTAARQLSPVSAGALGGGLGSITRLDVELTDLQKRFHDLDAPFDAVGEASYKVAKAMKDAADNVALFKQAWKRGNITGGAQAGADSAIGDALMNFTPQALAYQAVSAGINYIVSGLKDTALAMLGMGASATEARREMRLLTDEYKAAAAAFRHDDLGAALASDAAQFEQLMKQLGETLGSVSTIVLGGKDAIDAYKKALADSIAQEERNQALIKQQAAEKQQYAQEDLIVRNLRATGHGDQADLLAFKEAQAREYQAAQEKAMADGIVTAAEQLYLNTLSTTQNNELLAYQNGLLQNALRNAPTGFYGSEYYAGQFATPRTPEGYPTDSGITHPTVHGAPGGNSAPPRGTPVTIQLNLDGRQVTAVVIDNIDQYAASTNGTGTSRSAALDTMPKRYA